MKRWVCPSCGNGKLAPEKPKKLDVRRWCLDCSANTGTLVERSCPAVERKRTAQKERSAARRQKRTTRQREKKLDTETFGGVHVPTLVKQLCRQLVKLGYKRMRHVPEVEARRSTSYGHGVGHAYYSRHRITMTMSPRLHPSRVYELVAHELCHLAAGVERRGRRRIHHGTKFNRALCSLAKAMWDVDVYIDEGGGGYGPSRALTRALRDKLATDSAHERSHNEKGNTDG